MEFIPFLIIATVVLFVAKSVYGIIKSGDMVIKEQKDKSYKSAFKQDELEQDKKTLVKYVAEYLTWVHEAKKSYVYHCDLSDDVCTTPKLNTFLNTISVSFLYQFDLPDFMERKFTLYSIDNKGNEFHFSDLDEEDVLYDEAVNIVTETRKASISGVQRRLKIGYNRAARMIEAMELAGIVGPVESNGSREVLPKPIVKNSINLNRNIFENITPSLEQYYADIRPDTHPDKIKDLKSNVEVLFEPKLCVYHLDVLFELVDKSKDALEKSITKSQSLFNVRDFVAFWESLNVVNIILNEMNALVNMIDVQIKQYRHARKQMITKKLRDISEPPATNTPSLNLDEIKVSSNILKETLVTARSDYDFSSILQITMRNNDMSYTRSMSKMFDNTLLLLESCLVEVKYHNGSTEQQASTITDNQEQKTEIDEIKYEMRKSSAKTPDCIVDKKSEVVGRKPRKEPVVSQIQQREDKADEVVTGRKPRFDNSNGANSLSDKISSIDKSDVPEVYTGRKPRSS